MGLQLTLPKECNNLYYDFEDAYWYISELGYDTEYCYFNLMVYPNREVRLMDGKQLPSNPLPIGGLSSNAVKGDLYRWKGIFPIIDIFPNGIPINSNEQKTAVYNFIKAYTELPFGDVYEY